MALRVLLADESSTIKKVISLALQDFAVEVKVVHSGVDVVEVAKQFNPDIIFADVLLQKKNGYEVCYDVKNDALLSKIPVVLMWSSFMDLDEKSYKMSKANAKLEKPFEVEDLRKLVNTLANKTQSQAPTASQFLKFPTSMTDSLKKEQREKQSNHEQTKTASIQVPVQGQPPRNVGAPGAPPAPPQNKPVAPVITPPPQAPQADSQANNWNMDSFEDIQIFTDDEDDPAKSLNQSIDNFAELKLTQPNKDLENTATRNFNLSENSSESWEPKDLSQFKIDVSDDEDPFALMDLNKADKSLSGQFSNNTFSGGQPKAQPKKDREQTNTGRFQSFDFPEDDANSAPLNLELEDLQHVEQTDTTPPVANQEGGGDWNFKLPEHEVSSLEGNFVDLPEEYGMPDKSDISMIAESALATPPPLKKDLPRETRESVRENTVTKPRQQMPPPAPPLRRVEELENFESPEPVSTPKQPPAPPQRPGVQNNSQPQHQNNQRAFTQTQNIDTALVEKIVREQTRELVEKIIQRILPDMAKQLIQKELDRLLNEENT